MEEQTQITEQPTNQKFDWKVFLSPKWVVRNIPFFLFLGLLAVAYIYNGHYADKLARKISTTEKHISELEYEYKTIKSEMMFRSRESELVKAAEPLGLKLDSVPPVRIKAVASSSN